VSISASRAAAFDILLRVERENSYASELLHSTRVDELSTADRALTTELVMGVLRWRSLLDDYIARYSTQKISKLDAEVLVALRLAAYQVTHLQRIPARAAVHESVELVKRARKRSAAPFVNAVLRKLVQAADQPGGAIHICDAPSTPAQLSSALAHPDWLVKRWVKELGFDNATRVCFHDQEIPVTSIRLRDASAEAQLATQGIELAPGVLLNSARRVICGDVTKTSVYDEGRIAIQDEASQLVALLVGEGPLMLDCCAAPGGKTSVIAERNPHATIIAAELHSHRACLLRKHVLAPNVRVVAADAQSLPFGMCFDRVLADVPCSGTGTLARNPEIKWQLKPEDITHLQSRQLAILRSAMCHVEAGGRLVYSTCSLEREENEEVVETALAEDTRFHLVDCKNELQSLKNAGELALKDVEALTRGPYLRTIPGLFPVDGFFAAILQKRQD